MIKNLSNLEIEGNFFNVASLKDYSKYPLKCKMRNMEHILFEIGNKSGCQLSPFLFKFIGSTVPLCVVQSCLQKK